MENGHATENGHGINGEPNTLAMDYGTDFPSLPVSVPNDESSCQASAWTKPRPMPSKNSTLTFVLTPAERSASKVKSTFGTMSEERKRADQIASTTGCRIELNESKDGALTVIIHGPRHKVEEARNQIVRGLQTQDKQQISIPKDHHRKLIGKEGAALKELEQRTNCTITIPKRDQASDIIEIKGPAEGIRAAMAHIQNISQREASQAVEHIICPRVLYPFVRGPNNETTDKLVADHGVKINIPPSHANNEVINISGPKEGVAYAATVIRKIVSEKEKTAKHISINVAKTQHRFIIGQQRSGLHEILRATGVSVEVPETEDASESIVLRGEPAKLNDALVLVLQRASSVITQSIECPVWLHKYLIGPQGATLTTLVPNRTKVQIDFDDGGHIFLEGSPEEVKTAFAALDTESTRLKNEMAIEKIKVKPELHRHVIGRGGSLISKIKEESGVQISIPKEATNSDEITVEGKKAGVAKAVKEIKAHVSKIENEKSRDLIVDQRLHKLLIGSKGSEIGKIRDKFPNVVLSFPEANKKSDVINIRGDKTEVDEVHKTLTKQVKDIQEKNYQEYVPIFKECHKHIIGKGGATIRKIREETDTRIDLPDGNSGEEKILVTGRKENVKKAVEQLNKIQNELESITTITLDIPVKVQARLLGGGRRLIQNIEEECGGVHIKFPAEKSDSTKVTVRGPKDDAERAEKLLSALAKDKEQNLVEDTVNAKAEFHRFLIGKGGSKINKIRESHDVRVMFPRETDEDKETIHLLGKKEDVAQVKQELESLIQQLNETVEDHVEIDPKYHKHFLVRNAALLKEIQAANGGVTISFPRGDAPAATVTIKGIKQGVESAKARMEEIVEDLEKEVRLEIEVPQDNHRAILGAGGENVKTLQAKYSVKIHIPHKDEKSNIIIIVGRDVKAEAARDEVLALVPVQETINIPVAAQRYIIGKGMETLRQIMNDHRVFIKVPSRDSKDEKFVIKGGASNVEAALDDIRQRLQDVDAQQFQFVLEVPSDYHSVVIGADGGATIKKLRHDFGVEIEVPKFNEGVKTPDTVTITGYEEKAKACGAEIKSMIDELLNRYIQEVSLDSRFHSKLRWAKKLKELSDKYQVELIFPRNDDPNLVIVAGKDEELVFDCIDHLKDEEETWLDTSSHRERPKPRANAFQPTATAAKTQNVVINNAPWQMDASDFPEMAAAPGAPAQAVGGAWGVSRRW